MIPYSWFEKQVFSLTAAELKNALKRQRLRVSRKTILSYVWVLWTQHTQMCHFSALKQTVSVSYQGMMKGCHMVAPLMKLMEERFRQEKGIGFDDLNIVDSSLVPSKEEKSITPKDWDKGRVTTRPHPALKENFHICGDKHLCFINSKRQIVFSKLLNINHSDGNILKSPLSWAQLGLRQGVLLMDRGFGHTKVKAGFDGLRENLSSFDVHILYPPLKSQKWVLTPEERALYKKRWAIEEVFRQLKNPFGSFRLILKGIRKPELKKAKVAMATLAWNAFVTA